MNFHCFQTSWFPDGLKLLKSYNPMHKKHQTEHGNIYEHRTDLLAAVKSEYVHNKFDPITDQ